MPFRVRYTNFAVAAGYIQERRQHYLQIFVNIIHKETKNKNRTNQNENKKYKKGKQKGAKLRKGSGGNIGRVNQDERIQQRKREREEYRSKGKQKHDETKREQRSTTIYEVYKQMSRITCK